VGGVRPGHQEGAAHREVTQVIWDVVAVPRTVTTMCYTRVPVAAPCAPAITNGCGGCGSYGGCGSAYACGPSYQTVATPVAQTVMTHERRARTVTATVQVQVCECVTRSRTLEENVVEYVPTPKSQMVKVTTYEQSTETRDVDVLVCRAVVVDVDAVQVKLEKKSRVDKVEVVEHQTSSKKVKRPVTTYQTRMRTITEKVPVTMCVPVVAPQAVCPPVTIPQPGCY
jgi:hypothetical protein